MVNSSSAPPWQIVFVPVPEQQVAAVRRGEATVEQLLQAAKGVFLLDEEDNSAAAAVLGTGPVRSCTCGQRGGGGAQRAG